MSLISVAPGRRKSSKRSRWFGPPISGAGTPRSAPTVESYFVRPVRGQSGLFNLEDVTLEDYSLPNSCCGGQSTTNILSPYPLSTHRPSKRPYTKPTSREAQESPPVLSSYLLHPHPRRIKSFNELSTLPASSGAKNIVLSMTPREVSPVLQPISHSDWLTYYENLNSKAQDTSLDATEVSRWKLKCVDKLSRLRALLQRLILGVPWLLADWLNSPQRNWTKISTLIALASLIVTTIAAIDPLDNFFRVKMATGFQETRTQDGHCNCSPHTDSPSDVFHRSRHSL
ncbi:hypothetical protein F5X99DRAFT_386655 [Biscogniauxia marginata]|nr:hypothetical protein F5X99DRAFT_386655 [Biscogniauxia marginata]